MSSPSLRPRKRGWTASRPPSTIPCRSFSTRYEALPTRSPSDSATSHPNDSGSRSERSMSARTSSSDSGGRPRNSRVSSPVTSSRRKSASEGFARRSSTDTDRRYPNATGPERDADEYEREAADRSRPEALAEEDGAVRERDRRDEVRDERRVRRARARDQREEQEISQSRAGHAERDDRSDLLPAGRRVRRLDDPRGERGEGGDRRRREPDHDGRHGREVPAGEEAADRVAERHPDDRERTEHLPRRLCADEERDSDEPDEDSGKPEARDADLAEEAERDHRVEDRDRRLEDRREAGVDSRLAPGQEPERHRRVDERDRNEPNRVPSEGGHGHARAGRKGDDGCERHCGETQPPQDQRRRRQLPVGDLDEHEGSAPDERERDEHHEVRASHGFICSRG